MYLFDDGSYEPLIKIISDEVVRRARDNKLMEVARKYLKREPDIIIDSQRFNVEFCSNTKERIYLDAKFIGILKKVWTGAMIVYVFYENKNVY